MKVAIMQPYLFPYIGYFQVINAVDTYVIYDDVNFIKGGWINRNTILLNEEKKMVTINLEGASQNKLINEITIGDNFVKFRKTLHHAYAKAPYFHRAMELIDTILAHDEKNLASFAGNSLMQISTYLNIHTEFLYSSALPKDCGLKGKNKILSICQGMKADVYINAIGGTELYDKSEFRNNGIDLFFLRPITTEYTQFKNQFVPSLSIIDVLMFNAPADITRMLTRYELL